MCALAIPDMASTAEAEEDLHNTPVVIETKNLDIDKLAVSDERSAACALSTDA